MGQNLVGGKIVLTWLENLLLKYNDMVVSNRLLYPTEVNSYNLRQNRINKCCITMHISCTYILKSPGILGFSVTSL